MTAPAIGRTSSRRNNLLMLASLVIAIAAAFVPIGGTPVAAQPLCLNGRIWSEEAQSCVDMAEEPEPAEPIVEDPATVAVETPAEVMETPATDEEAQSTETAAPLETSAATEVPPDDGGPRSGSLSALSMFQRACPAGLDPRTADQETLWSMCGTYSGEVVYSLTVDGDVFGSAMSPMMPAIFGSVPPGDFAVSQSVPPGYTGPALVTCRTQGAPLTSVTRIDFAVGNDGGAFLLQDVPPNTYWQCESYLVPITTGDITAYVFEMPSWLRLVHRGA